MKRDMHIIPRMLLATRTWNPMMWVCLPNMALLLLIGADRTTLIGASVAFVGALAWAFLIAAAIVSTLSEKEQSGE